MKKLKSAYNVNRKAIWNYWLSFDEEGLKIKSAEILKALKTIS